MKATKNMNGAARVAVQAKLDAADKELAKAHNLALERQHELARVRSTVERYTVENDRLRGAVRDLSERLDHSTRQLQWVSESCRKHLDTIQALEAKQIDHAEFVEKLELELDIAEEHIQYHKESAGRWRFTAWLVFGAYTVVAAVVYVSTL